MNIDRDGVQGLHVLLWIFSGFQDRHRVTKRSWRTEILLSFADGLSSGASVCFVSFIGCVCVLCECPFIGASKQPSIDPLDLLDVFCRGASCLERVIYSLYTLARSGHEAIRLSVVCMV